jgi:hypothetical protein
MHPMSATEQDLEKRFRELLEVRFTPETNPNFVWSGETVAAHAWLIEATNLIGLVSGERGLHYEEARQSLASATGAPAGGVRMDPVRKLQGILRATYSDWKQGLLNVRYADLASTFDDFLDHAHAYHKSGKKLEAAVLASAVLEDVMRKIAEKHSINERSLEPIIEALVVKGVSSPVQAKRVRAYAGVRTSAFHARWEELDLRAIGEAIAGIHELIQHHLA